jgi:hypothetical protein
MLQYKIWEEAYSNGTGQKRKKPAFHVTLYSVSVYNMSQCRFNAVQLHYKHNSFL